VPRSLKPPQTCLIEKVLTDNEFQKSIRQLIPAKDTWVNFPDIGALNDVRESLQEAVMLPLRRLDLLKDDGVWKSFKGVLFFGPLGTGKTMHTKAICKRRWDKLRQCIFVHHRWTVVRTK
jgi:transitional endoplasmic reticulum ATPase